MSRREGPAARPALQDAAWLPRVGPTAPRAGAAVRGAPRPGGRVQAPSFAMGHNNSWVSPNTSHPRNTSSAEAGANRSALGELSEAHLYRQFTITVQVIIFIGSLLGKPPRGDTSQAGLPPRTQEPPWGYGVLGLVWGVEGGSRMPR